MMASPAEATLPPLEDLGHPVVGHVFVKGDGGYLGVRIGTLGDDEIAMLMWPNVRSYDEARSHTSFDVRSCTWTGPPGYSQLRLGNRSHIIDDINFDLHFIGEDVEWFMLWMSHSIARPWIGLEESMAAADKTSGLSARCTFKSVDKAFARAPHPTVRHRMFALPHQDYAFFNFSTPRSPACLQMGIQTCR